MQKIPTIFERDWDGDRSRVTSTPNPDCAWVFAGEGVATRKYDGSACLIRNGELYRREAVRDGVLDRSGWPEGFVFVEREEGVQVGKGRAAATAKKPGKDIGWTPVGDGPEDRWHREALKATFGADDSPRHDGTYELVGPKVQGNPEGLSEHRLLAHASAPQIDMPRDFDGILNALDQLDIEGVVFHHPDGRMAKIKKRDFGLRR